MCKKVDYHVMKISDGIWAIDEFSMVYLYVIEGVLTAWLDDCEYQLYPGDTMWIPSNHKHKWQNNTPHIVKLLSVGIRLEASKK